MANLQRVAQFVLKGVDNFTPTAKGAERALGGLGSAASKLGALFGGLALGAFFKRAIEEANGAEDAIIRLGTAVSNAGGDFAAIRGPLDELIDGLVRTTTASDDDLREAFTRLVTLTGDVDGAMRDLGTVADIAAYKQIGVAEAAEKLGKAQQGNTRVLKEFGVVGLEGAAALDKLRANVAGYGEAAAKTTSGALKQMQNQFGELLESVGAAILANDQFGAGVGGITGMLADLGKWIDANAKEIGLFTGAVIDLARAFGVVLGPIVKSVANILYTSMTGLSRLVYVVAEAVGNLALKASESGWFSEERTAQLRKFGSAMNIVAEQGYLRIARAAPEAATEVQTFGAVLRTTTGDVEQHTAATKKAADANEDYVATADDVRRAQERQAKAMKELGVEATKALNAAMKELGERLDRLHPNVTQFERELESLRAEVDRAYEAMLKAFRDDAIEKKRAAAEKLAGTITTVARAALDLADAFGIVDDRLATAINSAINLGASLAKIAGGDLSAGTLVSAITSAANLITKLFGKSPALEQHERAIRSNERALVQLTGVMTSSLPGQKIAATSELLRSLGLTAEGSLAGDRQRWTTASVMRAAGQYGLTVGDLDRLAKELGLTLDIRDGSVSRAALQQLLAAIGQVEFRPFGGGVGGKLAQFDELVAGGVLGDPAAQLEWLRTAVGSANSRPLAEAISGVDYATASGRATALTRLRGLLANANTLGPADLGGLNGSEFIALIQRYIGLLSQLGAGAAPPVPGDVGAPAAAGGSAAPAAGTAPTDFQLALTTGPGWLATIAASLGGEAPYLRGILEAVTPLAQLQREANGTLRTIADNTARGITVRDLAERMDQELYRRGVTAAAARGLVG